MQVKRLALLAAIPLSFVLAACDRQGATTAPIATQAPAKEVPTMDAGPASSEDVALIAESLTATQALKSYHYALQFDVGLPTAASKLEGDYLAPDKGYMKGTVGAQNVEKLFANGQMFTREGDHWARQDLLSLKGEETLLFAPMVMQGFATVMNFRPLDTVSYYFPALTDVKDTGTGETMNGVAVLHFTFALDGAKPAAGMAVGGTPTGVSRVGRGEIWIDPNTRFIHKLTVEVETAATGTAAGEKRSKEAYTVALSRHGDPSISLPKFDFGQAMAAPAASPAAAGAGRPELVQRALDTLDRLHTFHYRMEITGGPTTDEDFVTADLSIRRKQHANTYPIETELYFLDLGINFRDTGNTETINGVATQVFKFTIPFYGSGMDGSIIVPPDAREGKLPPLGEGTVYIDPRTANLHKLVTVLDLDALGSGSGGSASGQVKLTTTVVLSRHNDPSIRDTSVAPEEVTRAIAEMEKMRAYHFDFAATAEGVTETLNMTGDFVAPGDAYVRQVFPDGGADEVLLRGGKNYSKQQGKWQEQPYSGYASLPGGISVDLMMLVGNNFDLVDLFRKELAAATDFRDTGKDEQSDGTQVRAFTFRLGPFAVRGGNTVAPMRISNESQYIGEGTLYVDPKTRLIYKLVLTQQSSSVAGSFGGADLPKTFTVTTLYSRHNDAGIKLPKP